MVSYTITYYDLVNGQYFTPPAIWSNADAWPQPDNMTFAEYFMTRYGRRQIATETIPGFLPLMERVTAEILTFLPTLKKVFTEYIDDAESEEFVREFKAAPTGAELETVYTTGGETNKTTKRGADSGNTERAEHILLNGKSIFQIVADKYDECFLQIW